MKVICDGLDLSDAVLKVSKALSVKAANPVLEGIKITATGDKLTLVATDTELTIEKSIKAEVLMEGETVVVVKYTDSESELQVFPSESFPLIKKDGEENHFVIKQQDFKELVERTLISCSTDDSRPILKGCLFEVEKNVLTGVALDGFRMSVVKKEVESTGSFKAVIPARTLSEIVRLLDKEEEKLKICLQKNNLYVEIGSTVIYSRLIEGEFVKYTHILPTNFANVVTVNKDALLNSIERASIVARNDRFNVIKFEIKENSLGISARSEIGNVNENVNINLSGKDMVIAFNGKYLTDYLKIAGVDFININLNSPIDPCIITPVGKEDFMYLVLPVRING